MGKILTFGMGIGAALNDRMGCTGVAKAGDDEGIGFGLAAGVAGGLKIGAAFDFLIGSRRPILSN